MKEAAMSTKPVRINDATSNAGPARVAMKFEIVIIPVSDVDRAKEFYTRLGWRLDGDFTNGADWRGIQFTPPGDRKSTRLNSSHRSLSRMPSSA